jgi:hypothetical protein
LNPDGVAAKVVGDADGGDVHPALLKNLIECQFAGGILAEAKFHAFGDEPVVDALSFGLAHSAHLGHQRGLAEALLEDAGWVEQFVVDDRVVHPHAAFVEDAHDGFAMLQFSSEAGAEFRGFGGQFRKIERFYVRNVVGDFARAQPLVESRGEIRVGELPAPDGRERCARFDERSVEIEQADEARPLT